MDIEPATTSKHPLSSPSTSPPPPPPTTRKGKRPYYHPNIYSAVAGHYSLHGFIPTLPITSTNPSATRDTSNISRAPLAPAEVLFKSSKAPDRYEEPALDPYGAHRWLESQTTRQKDVYVDKVLAAEEGLREGRGVGDVADWRKLEEKYGNEDSTSSCSHSERKNKTILRQRPSSATSAQLEDGLPDSDLCKALHRYASAFYISCENDMYGNSQQRGSASTSTRKETLPTSFQSMDETALLALAILLEETMRAHVRPPRMTEQSALSDAVAQERSGRDGWRALLSGVNSDGEEIDPLYGAKQRAFERSQSRANSQSRSKAWREAERARESRESVVTSERRVLSGSSVDEDDESDRGGETEGTNDHERNQGRDIMSVEEA